MLEQRIDEQVARCLKLHDAWKQTVFLIAEVPSRFLGEEPQEVGSGQGRSGTVGGSLQSTSLNQRVMMVVGERGQGRISFHL